LIAFREISRNVTKIGRLHSVKIFTEHKLLILATFREISRNAINDFRYIPWNFSSHCFR